MKHELQEECKLSFLAEPVGDANVTYRAGLLAHIDEGGEGADLDQLQQAELDETTIECKTKLDEVRRTVRDETVGTIW